jgi:membrane protein DedA with SNARE-associated domain
VMPFAGFLVAQGNFNFILVIIASSLGSITGSLIYRKNRGTYTR